MKMTESTNRGTWSAETEDDVWREPGEVCMSEYGEGTVIESVRLKRLISMNELQEVRS